MEITAVQQRNNVSEGMAFGLALHRIGSLAQSKIVIDLAFAGAWRNWSPARLFPQVTTDMRTHDGYRVLTRADARKQTHAFYWESRSGTLVAVPRDPDWNVDSASDVEFAHGVIDDRVSATQWADLAGNFVSRLSARGATS